MFIFMFLVEIAIIIIIWGVNPCKSHMSWTKPYDFLRSGADSSREQQRPMAAMPRRHAADVFMVPSQSQLN